MFLFSKTVSEKCLQHCSFENGNQTGLVSDLGFGGICRLEVFDGVKFDKWVETATAPPIESSLKLYEEILKLGFKVFLLTGRGEKQRGVTVENLINAGFRDWDKLVLRLVFR